MMETIKLVFSLIAVLFVPGYFFSLAIFGKNISISPLERMVFSFGASIILVDFLMLASNRIGIALNASSILLFILAFSILSFAYFLFVSGKKTTSAESHEVRSKIFFDKKQFMLFALAIVMIFVVKMSFTGNNIMPSSTDLGHHMYWVNSIIQNEKIPEYTSSEIEFSQGTYRVSEPAKINDFIIGEHLIFAAIGFLSGVSVISPFPVIILFFVNIFSILTLFIFASHLFRGHKYQIEIAVFALFVFGALFSIAPPQQKYVTGGVIGNLIGNLLVPLIFLYLFRFVRDKRITFFLLALFFTMGLFYTHHLSSLLFLFFISFFLIILAVFERESLVRSFSVIFRPHSLLKIGLFFFFVVLFALFVYTPSYLENSAVKTVVGDPMKKDHEGLSISQVKYTIGEPRMIAGIIGLLLLFLLRKKNPAVFSLFAGWLLVVLIVSLWPTIFRISIPSSRVANYGSLPASILASYFLFQSLVMLRSEKSGLLKKTFIVAGSSVIIYFFIFYGTYDNIQYVGTKDDPKSVNQTFHASGYLSRIYDGKSMIMKDHVYTAADSWMKIFFMKDYNFPLYRANIFRYEEQAEDAEDCTLFMISDPASEKSSKCFSELSVSFVVANKEDAPKFDALKNFSKIYTNYSISIYQRNEI